MKTVSRSVAPVCVLALLAGSALAAPPRERIHDATTRFRPFAPGEHVTQRPENGCLYLRCGEVRTGSRPAAAETIAEAPRRMILQLDGPLTRDRAAQLRDAGVRLGQYLPSNAYLVRTRGIDSDKLDQLDFVRWHGAYQKAWKMVAEPQDRVYVTPERQLISDRGECVMVLSLFEHADPAETVAQLETMPGVIVAESAHVGDNPTISVIVPRGLVAQLTDLTDVLAIEEAPEAAPRMATSTWVVQSNVPDFTPLHDNGLTGEGQIVSVIDLPVDDDNCAFRDENAPAGSQFDKWVAILDNGSPSGHGTAVCSMIAGDGGVAGSENPDLVGIAPDARLVFNRIPSFDESALVTDFEDAHAAGARIHSNSWGEDASSRNFYNVWARAIDVFTRAHEDDLVVFASTNLSVLRTPENSRNVVATGASWDSPLQTDHASGGIGPTGDGRRKPELYAPGRSIRAAAPNTCNDSSSGLGTSFACPQIAAGGALMRQYYMDGYYPTGAPEPADAFTPTGALLKATLMNSGVDMTGEAGYPANLEGWGRVLLDEALHFAGELRTMLVTDVRNSAPESLSTGDSHEEDFNVTVDSEKLKVTLVYTDVPAAPSAVFVPVNDLDLEVVSPMGEVYKGNVFSGGVSTTGGSADILNNVEQVHIDTPMTGVWTFRVLGTAVNEETQGFAVVISGAVSPASADPCPADLNNDGTVDSTDLAMLLAEWETAGTISNLDGVGVVDDGDLAILLASWGPCPT